MWRIVGENRNCQTETQENKRKQKEHKKRKAENYLLQLIFCEIQKIFSLL